MINKLPDGFEPLATSAVRLTVCRANGQSIFYLSKGAFELLQKPKSIRIGVNENHDEIALVWASPGCEGSTRLRPHGSGARFGHMRLASKLLGATKDSMVIDLEQRTTLSLVGRIEGGERSDD